MHPDLIKLEKQFKSSIVTKINDPWLDEKGVEIWMKRDDLLHPIISGNKWRKLKFIFDHVLSLDKNMIISMGGAWSNHLHALAFAGKSLNLKTEGIIRGEKPDILNPTLADLKAWGMNLKFISRSDYRQLRQFIESNDLPGLKSHQYWLPEGGALNLALAGVGEMIAEINLRYSTICVPCGTGTTLAGVIAAVPEKTKVIGFSALKNADFLYRDVKYLLENGVTGRYSWSINMDYHFGGFAKITPALKLFIDDFKQRQGIALDYVYTGKMMYGIYDLIRHEQITSGQRIVAVHTGGVQGNRGVNLEKSA